ncbi:MAG: DUF1080 domain-containing protein [Pirellulaceae bacterium]
MKLVSLTLSVVMLLGLQLLADDGNPAYTSVKEAGADYAIQGEYEGVVEADGNRWGAQIIALGDGEFEVVGFLGGLPGAGWERGDEINRATGKMKGDVAVFDAGDFLLKAGNGVLKVVTPDDEVLGKLEKVERTSPTLGAKPPAGAVVLFDGSSVEGWENGKLTEAKLLAANGTSTKEKFGDHHMHIEFRTPFKPKSRGQARGNSGVYVTSRYEVQVLDSFGLEGADNECGGIYSINRPIVNMCLPPLTWQTYDIDFTAAEYDGDGKKTKNARITVRHNGVVIHDDQELAHGTPGRFEEAAGPEALFLQDHGNPVVFRNIWAVKK